MNSSAASKRLLVMCRSNSYACHPSAASPVPCTAMTSRGRVKPRSCAWWWRPRATSGVTTDPVLSRFLFTVVFPDQIVRGFEQALAVCAFGVCVGHPPVRHRLHNFLPFLDFFI